MMNMPTLEFCVENLKKVIEGLDEVVAEDQSEWDMLTYYTKLLHCGSQIGYSASLIMPRLAVTMHVDNMDRDTVKEFYDNIQRLSVSVANTFYTMSQALLEANPTEEKVETEEFIS